jgi:hypothetical protein
MLKLSRSVFVGAVLAFAMACLVPVARASSITYYYTGKEFTSYSGGFTCPTATCSLTGSMTLASPLGDNAFSDPTAPVSYSFSDGVTTFDNSNSTLINSLFATDGSGQITNWVLSGNLDNNQFTWYQSANWPGNAVGDLVQLYGEGQASSSVAGTWSDTPPVVTPEPATGALLATGMLLLLLAPAWRRWRFTQG